MLLETAIVILQSLGIYFVSNTFYSNISAGLV
jgi:hypothetical protein